MHFALEREPKKSKHHHSNNLLGISGEHLTDIDQLSLLAGELGLPDHAHDIRKVKSRRKWIRAADVLSQLATLSSITALSQVTSWGAEGSGLLLGLGAGAFIANAAIRSLITGRLGTDNDSTLVHEASALTAELRRANLGTQGEEAADALSLLPNVSEEERMLYARPGEIILSEVAQWMALIACSPEPLNTAVVGIFNTVIAVAQTFFVHKGFAPANKNFVAKSTDYLAQPSSAEARQAYLDAKERKVAATSPINFLSSISGFLPILVGKLPVSTMVAGLVARGMSAFSNITQRTISITHAADIQRSLRPKIDAALKELRLFIKNQSALDNHILNSMPESFNPVNLLEKIKALRITDAILVNAQVRHPDQLGNKHQLLLDFADGHRIKIIAGDNGSGKTTLRRLITHEMDNHLGYVGIVTPEGGLKDIHNFSYAELEKYFPFWSDSTYRTPVNPLLTIPAERLSEIATIPGLSWILQDRIVRADATSGSTLSDGERKILSIIHFVETHRNDAHSLWLDEVFAKLHPDTIESLQAYFVVTGCRYVLIQQEPNAKFDPRDLIYLNKYSDTINLLHSSTSKLDTQIFFEATSYDVDSNPLVIEKIWENNPEKLVHLISQGNADAVQLITQYKTATKDGSCGSLLHGLREGLAQYLEHNFDRNITLNLISLEDLLFFYHNLGTYLKKAGAPFNGINFAVDVLPNYLDLTSKTFIMNRIHSAINSFCYVNGVKIYLRDYMQQFSHNVTAMLVSNHNFDSLWDFGMITRKIVAQKEYLLNRQV